MSVMTLGIFWVGQQTDSNHFARADRNLGLDTHRLSMHRRARPLSTSLLAEFTHYRIALLVYWFNILLLGLTLYWSGTKPAASTFSPMIRRPTFIERLCVAS